MTWTWSRIVGAALLLVSMPCVRAASPEDETGRSPVIDVALDVEEEAKLAAAVPRMSLEVSSELGKAFVAVQEPLRIQDIRAGAAVGLMEADLQTGGLTPLSKLLKQSGDGQAVGVELSPDRRNVVILLAEREGISGYAVDLADGKKTSLGKNLTLASWAGAKVAISSLTSDGKLAKLQVVDPSGGESAELPVRGILAAGLPDGALLIGADPERLTDKLSPPEMFRNGRLLHVSADGKVLHDIAPIGILSSPPVVSPNGKFFGFQSKPADAPEGPGTHYGFTVFSIDGKHEQRWKTPYFPMAIMDDGSAVVMSAVSDANNMRVVRWLDQHGKQSSDIVKAVSACVIGDSLIYATNEPAPAIKTIALDKEPDRRR